MKKQNRFQETKIKLVMKLRGLTREAAIKALRLEKKSGGADDGETRYSKVSVGHVAPGNDLLADDCFLSADDFFRS